MHLCGEYSTCFDLNTVTSLLKQTCQTIGFQNAQDYLAPYKTELLFHWLEIVGYAEEPNILLDSFIYSYFGYDDYAKFLTDYISEIASYCFLKSKVSDQQLTMDKNKKLKRLLFLILNCEEKSFPDLLSLNSRFAIQFYSRTFLSIFLNNKPKEYRIGLVKSLFKQNLLNAELIKKHFHFVIKEVFSCLYTEYFCLDHENSQTYGNFTQIEASIIDLIETLISVYIDNSPDKQSKNQDTNGYRLKTLSSLIQINLSDHLASNSTNQSLTAIYNIIYGINQKTLSRYTNMSHVLYLFRVNKIFFKYILFSSSKESTSINFLTSLINKNNYQIFLHHFIAFKLSDYIKLCKKNLSKIQTKHVDQTEFYEVNIFNMRLMDEVIDVFTVFLDNLKCNKLEMCYFDWPVTCLVWNILDYLNFSESLTPKLELVKEFNTKTFNYLIEIVQANAHCSDRFKRLANFLELVLNSNAQMSFMQNNSNKDKLADVLMLNLAKIINTKTVSPSKNIQFEIELKSCLNSIDFERIESSKYILCYLSNLLIVEYKNKLGKSSLLTNPDSVESFRFVLRLFLNKLLNICASQQISPDLKDLACLCFSLIGPIDFQSCHLEIDKNEKYEMNYANLNENCHKRSYVLKRFARDFSNTMVHLYYLLVEHLLEHLISDKYEYLTLVKQSYFIVFKFNFVFSLKLSTIANDLLFKIFRTPQSVSFVNQYENCTADYEKIFPDHDEVDYFQEYIRPFLSKKQRVISL